MTAKEDKEQEKTRRENLSMSLTESSIHLSCYTY